MKMKLRDRVALSLGGLATLLAGIFSLIGGIVIVKLSTDENQLLHIFPYILMAFGVLAGATGVYSLLLPRRYHSRRQAFITQATEHGELRIAVSAIENLILRCVGTHKEIKVVSMQLHNRRGVVKVDLHLSISGNISIPQAVEQLQTQIKRYLAASSGIDLREITVSVDGTEGVDAAHMPAEPLPHTAEMMSAAAQSVQDAEEVSMHQRVFGRDATKSTTEQVAEAELIVPPSEEEELPEAEDEAPAEEPVETEAEAEEAEETEEIEEACEAESEPTEDEAEAADIVADEPEIVIEEEADDEETAPVDEETEPVTEEAFFAQELEEADEESEENEDESETEEEETLDVDEDAEEDDAEAQE